MKELISVQEARALVEETAAERAPGWGLEYVPLDVAEGRVLAEDVVSGGAYPPFVSSAMDGYAVAEGGEERRSYRLVGESRAGAPYSGLLRPGEAVRIATGAVVPDGTATIVPVELLEEHTPDAVTFQSVPAHGSHIRPAGKDVGEGERILEQGATLCAGAVSMLAMVGVAAVPVRHRPRIAIITTGDELLPASAPDPLPPGKIRDSNGPGLAALARATGCQVEMLLHGADSPGALRAALEQALSSDLVLLSGGVSMGAHDHVRPVLAETGVDLLFWRVRQRPGKPLAFGVHPEGPLIFGLPGNPVSSALCFLQYVRTAAETIVGRRPPANRFAYAALSTPLRTKEGLYHFIRGRATIGDDARVAVVETGAQDSNLISSILHANCLIHVPENVGHAEPGELVRIEWLPC